LFFCYITQIIYHFTYYLSGAKGTGPIKTLDINVLKEGFEAKTFAYIKTIQASIPYVRQSITLIAAGTGHIPVPGTASIERREERQEKGKKEKGKEREGRKKKRREKKEKGKEREGKRKRREKKEKGKEREGKRKRREKKEKGKK
jgi:hypothetical protein